MANQLYQGSNPLATTCPNVVDNLTSTSSTDALSAKQGKVLNDKITWTYVGELTTANNFNISNYEELNLIPYVNGAIPYNPYYIKKISNNMEFYLGIYQSPTHNTSRRVAITNGVITQTQNTLEGWTNCTIRIYAK